MKKHIALSCLMVLVALCGFAEGAPEQEKGPVLIGMQGPITGAWAYEGQMAKQSCEIAAMLINQKGGILGGRQIQIVAEDDAGEPKTGPMAATKMPGPKGVAAPVSPYGTSL